ncbi:MAG: methionine biosynthesis protein MetW [Candidatus Paceibacterota bacterium]|nr:MAG: methionine biosynthesis protein MetW [Candidatus Paceibacterota bacterium]
MSFLNTTKHYIRDLFKYPRYNEHSVDYAAYWQSRGVVRLNAFQRARALFLCGVIGQSSSVLDVGCGTGAMLAFLKEHGKTGELRGVDIAESALEAARRNGIDVIKGNIADPDALPAIDMHDYVTFFEVLEHMPHAEKLLEWGMAHARKAVVFSVPNTGFFAHRLRLLLGRFPLQWRAHPSEHVRFWTLRDMRWWLDAIGYQHAQVIGYVGVPVLYKLWPSLFAAGLMVVVPKNTDHAY